MSYALPAAQFAAISSPSSMPLAARIAVRFAVAVTKWDTRRKTRKHLKALPAHLLNDIGLDSATAKAEVIKPFWQA
ncbi:hypothetical protein DS901_09355 [Loktanella sp. D2R18]|uniref:DUF1127 domain-containing protein n=1 Tax=Rhodobacterales TaxID=204455 RepID=UPI000DEACE9C|nr:MULTISPECIES: DUF1127 domain-containing protein [Rhodobacterales]MDO6591598.1 DUF1127 domain-containing protein [Yoonia sp. 1_MG-2023]RBW43714.1 hypothetical protein DS901_09355 [Loktanella sp. D2R18]